MLCYAVSSCALFIFPPFLYPSGLFPVPVSLCLVPITPDWDAAGEEHFQKFFLLLFWLHQNKEPFPSLIHTFVSGIMLFLWIHGCICVSSNSINMCEWWANWMKSCVTFRSPAQQAVMWGCFNIKNFKKKKWVHKSQTAAGPWCEVHMRQAPLFPWRPTMIPCTRLQTFFWIPFPLRANTSNINVASCHHWLESSKVIWSDLTMFF